MALTDHEIDIIYNKALKDAKAGSYKNRFADSGQEEALQIYRDVFFSASKKINAMIVRNQAYAERMNPNPTAREIEENRSIANPYERVKKVALSPQLNSVDLKKLLETRREYASQKAITLPEQQKGIDKLSQNVNAQRSILRTKYQRQGYLSPVDQSKLFGLTLLDTVVVSNVKAIRDFPSSVKYYIKNPREVRNIPGNIGKQLKDFGYVARSSPVEATAIVAGNILTVKGTNKALDLLEALGQRYGTKLLPKYIGEAKVGEDLEIPRGGGKPPIRLRVTNKIPTESLRSQVRRGGRVVNAISSQADNLIDLVRSRKIIRKPIPNEEALSASARRLLTKFDEGTINSRELIALDRKIRNTGAKGLLERSFFADPSTRIRPSRLGIKKNGKTSLMDYVSEDITFKKKKPQILLFEDAQIEKLPRGLSDVRRNLLRNKTLTRNQTGRLLRYQQQRTGKFKPVGFVTRESEITLAPGEILQRVNKAGVTIVNGRRVPIVRVKVIRPNRATLRLLEKYESGYIRPNELRSLSKKLRKATGIKYRLKGTISSYGVKSEKYISLKKISALSASRGLSKLSIKPKVKVSGSLSRSSQSSRASRSYPTSSRSYARSPPRYSAYTSPGRSSPASPYKAPGRSSPGRYSTYRSKYPPRSPPKYPPRYPPKMPPKYQKSITYKKNIPIKIISSNRGYNVYARPLKVRKGQNPRKLIKVNKRPLTRERAQDLRNFIIDRTLIRTGQIRRTGGPGTGRINVPQGYARQTAHKFRDYRIVRGRRVPLPFMTAIEKRKYLLDTKDEKRAINLRKQIAYVNKVPRSRTRRSGPSRAQLQALARGRAKLARMRGR